MRRSLVPLLLILCAAACSYSPPARTDTASPKYQADLDACTTSVPEAVDKHNAKTGLAWMTGGLTRWSAIDSGVDACMGGHGWGHVRACTAEELRNGNRTQSLVVTARGIRCSDPNRPS